MTHAQRSAMMAKVLDGNKEAHEGPEPRVLTADVTAIIHQFKGTESDEGRVALLAERSGYSTRTVYRVLQGDKESIALDLADKLVLAAGSHLALCRLVWPDGRITPYN